MKVALHKRDLPIYMFFRSKFVFGMDEKMLVRGFWHSMKNGCFVEEKVHFFKMIARPCPKFTSISLNKRNDGIVRINLPKADADGFAIILKDKEYETIDP